MATPILVTGAAGRIGAVGRTVSSLHRAGRYDRMLDDVRRLTGGAPTTVRDFVRKNAVTFAAAGE
jgi:hypothetical protein